MKECESKKGSVYLGLLSGKEITFPYSDLKTFKQCIESLKEEEYLEYHNGIIRCRDISEIWYLLKDDKVEDISWMDFKDDDDDDEEPPESPLDPDDDEDDEWFKKIAKECSKTKA